MKTKTLVIVTVSALMFLAFGCSKKPGVTQPGTNTINTATPTDDSLENSPTDDPGPDVEPAPEGMGGGTGIHPR